MMYDVIVMQRDGTRITDLSTGSKRRAYDRFMTLKDSPKTDIVYVEDGQGRNTLG